MPQKQTDRALTPLGADLDVVLSSTFSDAHTWNLVFLQLLLEEMGHHVTNLGACMPEELLVETCRRQRPDLIVISTVNGHGMNDGIPLIRRLRTCGELLRTQVVIGGKLGITGWAAAGDSHPLSVAGFDAVFDDQEAVNTFYSFVTALSLRKWKAA